MGMARLVAMLAVALVTAFPAVAQAKVFEGAAQDPTGDQTAGSTAARDIVAISGRYDESAGSVDVSVQLAATPDGSDALITAFVRHGCTGTPWVALVDHLAVNPSDPGIWVTDDDTTQRPVTRGGTAPVVTLAASNFGVLAYEGYDCLVVQTAPAQGAPYDEAQVALVETVPPPAPTPAPTPTPAPRPPEPPPLGPAPLTRAEKLESALSACAGGKSCARTARKRYGPTKRELARTALDVCAKRKSAARRSCERKARARYRGVKAAPRPSGLERQLFAHGASDIMGQCGGICWEALSFVDSRFVYVGLPEGAGVPNCTSVTYDDAKKEGCTTYRLSANRRSVTVAGRTYAIGKDLVRHPEGTEKEPTKLERQVFPAAGSRWDVPKIEAIWVSGSPFVGTQIITKTYLTLTREGQFVKSSFSFGSSAPGVDPSLTFTSAPPDSRGTYEVLPAGTIRLAYQDGKVEVGSTFFWDATKGRNPNQAGLHAIDDTFFGPPDD